MKGKGYERLENLNVEKIRNAYVFGDGKFINGYAELPNTTLSVRIGRDYLRENYKNRGWEEINNIYHKLSEEFAYDIDKVDKTLMVTLGQIKKCADEELSEIESFISMEELDREKIRNAVLKDVKTKCKKANKRMKGTCIDFIREFCRRVNSKDDFLSVFSASLRSAKEINFKEKVYDILITHAIAPVISLDTGGIAVYDGMRITGEAVGVLDINDLIGKDRKYFPELCYL